MPERAHPTHSTSQSHWYCKACGTFDGPISGEAFCDYCADGATVERYLPADAVLEVLENYFHPQNPKHMHPADFLTRRFALPGHEGLRYV